MPYWEHDRIVRALQSDASHRGRPPTYNEWRRADPRGRRPTSPRVQQVFGAWSTALEAAGLDAAPRGRQPDGERCGNGHELAIDGYTSPAGKRHCRACVRDRERRQRARRAARREYLRRLRARQEQQGLCTRCGKSPAEPGRACCSRCLAYLRAADERRRQARTA